MIPPPHPPESPNSDRFRKFKAISFVGPSDSGKTELICRLIPWLTARGLRVAVLKHSHHTQGLEGDQGKDTWRFRQAGANPVALAAPRLLQITQILPDEPPLEEVLAELQDKADLVLVEGYKWGPLPKVAVLGEARSAEVPPYPWLKALVCREPVSTSLPCFHPDQVEELGRWLYDFLRQE